MTVSQLGDEIRKLSNGTFEYRQRDGFILRFDANKRLTSITDLNGNTITLNYTGNNLTSVTDAVGRSLTLAYDASNRIISATDPLGRVWRYTYANVAGVVLTTVTDPQNNTTNYGYVTGGRLASVTDGRGNMVKQITYNAQGRVIEQKFADQSFERYTYTLTGTMVSGVTVTDSLGRTENKRFNAAGYVMDYTDALGQVTHIERNMNSNLSMSRTGPCGCA